MIAGGGRVRVGGSPGLPPPDDIPVIGWRVWRIHPTGLCSAVLPSRWDVVTAADCKSSSGLRGILRCDVPVGGRVPHVGGRCGLYAKWSADAWRRDITTRHQVIGVIKAWGRIIEHENGFRAEYAQPVLLCYDPAYMAPSAVNLLPRLAKYECPLEQVTMDTRPVTEQDRWAWQTASRLLGTRRKVLPADGRITVWPVDTLGDIARRHDL